MFRVGLRPVVFDRLLAFADQLGCNPNQVVAAAVEAFLDSQESEVLDSAYIQPRSREKAERAEVLPFRVPLIENSNQDEVADVRKEPKI